MGVVVSHEVDSMLTKFSFFICVGLLALSVAGQSVLVSSDIVQNTVWRTGETYELAGRIVVQSGVTLTIERGVVVKARGGDDINASVLLVARGAKLNAEGTARLPIIFTSVADEITPAMVANGQYASPNTLPTQTGLWGGVIILGSAPISASDDDGNQLTELSIEGIPATDPAGKYGGNNPDDSSGTISYISIRHGGISIGAGNEINGLTLGGVGSGTRISNVEVVANADDGIEWFGGTVDVSNVLVWNVGDDALDTDQGWNGRCRDFLVVTPSGSGFELDGPEGTLSQGCNSFDDGILYAGNDIGLLVDWDENTNTGITDLYIYGIAANSEMIESYGGDGSCTSDDWEITVPAGGDVTRILNGVPASVYTVVPENGNSHGPSASKFAWTWAGSSGALASIGLVDSFSSSTGAMLSVPLCVIIALLSAVVA